MLFSDVQKRQFITDHKTLRKLYAYGKELCEKGTEETTKNSKSYTSHYLK